MITNDDTDEQRFEITITFIGNCCIINVTPDHNMFLTIVPEHVRMTTSINHKMTFNDLTDATLLQFV